MSKLHRRGQVRLYRRLVGGAGRKLSWNPLWKQEDFTELQEGV
jgi:hypothetical protein